MNRRGLEISMANPVNETISYQTHYVAESGGEGGAGKGDWGRWGGKATPGKGIPGRIWTRDRQDSAASPRAQHLRTARITAARIVFLFPRRAKYY